jgi:hypothetical protein
LQQLISGAGLCQKQLSPVALLFQREMKQLVNLPPTFRLYEVVCDLYLRISIRLS